MSLDFDVDWKDWAVGVAVTFGRYRRAAVALGPLVITLEGKD